ncbi:MAG TPA: ergothioneine biosynthesis protein EgtB [Hyphomicrobium sp.]|nr:ergothioneine biosynthesis protein EgtB [Hyphomicrobium sp.]
MARLAHDSASLPSHETHSPAPLDVLSERLFATRRLSLELAAPLSPEDMAAQVMDDASPTKWHLAHVTWFFETFVLKPHLPGYRQFDETFNFCFNSYYEALGARQPRPARGLLTRPSAERVMDYRAHVDEALERLAERGFEDGGDLAKLIEIGINHEQQHQELLLSDILALFAVNPLRPAYREGRARSGLSAIGGSSDARCEAHMGWISYDGGIVKIGHAGEGYAWDNESPQHDALVRPFRLADRLVTNGEWLEFMADGGYRTASLWLADGWTKVCTDDWRSPRYWEEHGSGWHTMTLDGLIPVERAAPVCHVSYYEADAFARWAGHRLPTEFEWELAGATLPLEGNTLGTRALRPVPAAARAEACPRQMFGDVWEWTQSAYSPYPGYRPPEGAIGEYNGKFMVSQQVLRGASFATPDGHSRATYRNFFFPHQRWQFAGVRLAAEET